MKLMPRELDTKDRAILRHLLENGRLTTAELADRVGLSASPCWQRVRRLEADGFIDGYGARVDMEQLGLRELAIVEVTLDRHDDETLEDFGQALADIPEVLEVYLTTGDYDYMIKVAVDGTRAYEEFLRSKLYKVKGIRHSRSSFVLRRLKSQQAFVPD